jgi:anti-sigma B factor antagonist
MTTLPPDANGPRTAPVGTLADHLASVSRLDRSGVIVATVRGEIDISNAAQVGSELTAISNSALGLVADLGDVEHLDSAGIAVLYELHLRLSRRGQHLVVVAPPGGAPRRVLELIAFDRQVELADELEAAVATVRRVGELSPQAGTDR